MRKTRKKLLIPLIFIFLLFCLIAPVFALQNYDQRVHKINSYHTQNENAVTTTTYPSTCTHDTYKTYCSSEQNYVNTIHYTQYGTEETRKNLFGGYVKEYSVYITNKGITGRYFTVTFELKDKNGYTFTQSVTQYLRTGEKKKFVYRDIQYEQNEILNWNYRIIPQR